MYCMEAAGNMAMLLDGKEAARHARRCANSLAVTPGVTSFSPSSCNNASEFGRG